MAKVRTDVSLSSGSRLEQVGQRGKKVAEAVVGGYPWGRPVNVEPEQEGVRGGHSGKQNHPRHQSQNVSKSHRVDWNGSKFEMSNEFFLL